MRRRVTVQIMTVYISHKSSVAMHSWYSMPLPNVSSGDAKMHCRYNRVLRRRPQVFADDVCVSLDLSCYMHDFDAQRLFVLPVTLLCNTCRPCRLNYVNYRQIIPRKLAQTRVSACVCDVATRVAFQGIYVHASCVNVSRKLRFNLLMLNYIISSQDVISLFRAARSFSR